MLPGHTPCYLVSHPEDLDTHTPVTWSNTVYPGDSLVLPGHTHPGDSFTHPECYLVTHTLEITLSVTWSHTLEITLSETVLSVTYLT